MTTLIDENVLASETVTTVATERKEGPFTAIVPSDTGYLSSQDKEADFKRSTAEFFSRWRDLATLVWDVSTAQGTYQMYTTNFEFLENNICNLLMTRNTQGNNSLNWYQMCHYGISWKDVQFKFTIYSIAQQQGIISVHVFPFRHTTVNSTTDWFSVLDGLAPAIDEFNSNSTMCQFPSKYALLGSNTEIIASCPYTSRYAFITAETKSVPHSAVMIRLFSPIEVVDGANGTVQIRIEVRVNGMDFVGSIYSGIGSLGTYTSR